MKAFCFIVMVALFLATGIQASHTRADFDHLKEIRIQRARDLIYEFHPGDDDQIPGLIFTKMSQAISPDNKGWLWSAVDDSKLREGTISYAPIFYYQVLTHQGFGRHTVGHYQKKLFFRDGKFYFLEEVWFSQEYDIGKGSYIFYGFFSGAAMTLIIAAYFEQRKSIDSSTA